jgi:spermidine synthase
VTRLLVLTAVLGTALLFLVEPMAAKALSPSVGGSPASWSAGMVVYLGLLLGGYAWAHLLARRLTPREQAIAQVVMVLIAVAVLPWRGLSVGAPAGRWPALWVIGTLVVRVGIPFFVLASTAPLLRRWLADVGDPGAREPSLLWAVSGAASLGALLAYPLVLERVLPLDRAAEDAGWRLTQNGLFCGTFLVHAALSIGCAVLVFRRSADPDPAAIAAPSSWRRRLGWAALAFVPSAATLAITQTITGEVAAVPLLWTLPLGLQLFTFVLAFARRRWLRPQLASWAVAGLSLAVAASQWVSLRPMPRLALPLHLLALLAVGLLCHGRLAAERPGPAALTDYYLSIAAGAALGAVFCGLLAPALFSSFAEYPIVLVLACLVRADPLARTGVRRGRRKVDALLALGVLAAVAIAGAAVGGAAERSTSELRALALVSCLTCAAIAFRPIAFAAGLAIVFFASQALGPRAGNNLQVERTFFGVLRVKDVTGPSFIPRQGPRAGQTVEPLMRELFAGTSLRGLQVMEPGLDHQATAYYHASGPIGHVFRALADTELTREVAVVGLGVGELASYARPSSRFTFFEIDPAVARIARDPELFSYLRDCRGRLEVVIGDARLALAAVADGKFGLVVLDAFSSDWLPVHLLTREAMALALRKLRPGGLLALHLTSRHFDLATVVAELAASLGRPGLFWDDAAVTPSQLVVGKQPSRWAVVAASAADLERLRAQGVWQPLRAFEPSGRPARPWTDRHASPLSALR